MSGPTPSSGEIQEWLQTDDLAQEQELFLKARDLTMRHFAHRIVLFAPLYVSNVCVNNCLYCGFRRNNALLERRILSSQEVRAEAEAIAAMGHQTVLIVAGEHPEYAGPRAIAEDIRSVESIPSFRDIKVEVTPMDGEGYRKLYEAGARAVILYQETYNRKVYAEAHPSGPKANYDWRLAAPERAMAAGFQRVGIGILVGLADVASDVAALIAHAQFLHSIFGFWPSTISLPRLQPAPEAPWSFEPPHPVEDGVFIRLIALLRVALPEVGIVLSTRECPVVRDRLLALGIGVTHLSAGSRTSVGGYTQDPSDGQFFIQDERPVSEVVVQLKALGYEPIWAEGEQP